MTSPAEYNLWHRILDGVEHAARDISKALNFGVSLLNRLHGFGAFPYASFIRRIPELVLDHGIDDNNRCLAGKAGRLVSQGAAVDFDGSILLAKHGDILVHDADRDADEIIFGPPAELSQFRLSDGNTEQQGESRADLNRCR